MKKFLLMAAMAMAATCTMNAQNACESCGEEGVTSAPLLVYASVRVPLSAYVADNSITFPCLNRTEEYTINSLDGAVHTHPGTSGNPMNTGRGALVEFYGDENDVISVAPSAYVVTLTHTNTDCEYADGNQNTGTMAMNLNYWSRTGPSFTSNPAVVGSPASAQGPWFSSNWNTPAIVKLGNGPDPTPGVGENDFYVGGHIQASNDQQRGCYYGSLTLHADYCP